MRVFELLFRATEAAEPSVYQSLVPHAPRRRASLYNFDVLDDGSTIELVQVEGERDEIVSELEHRENLVSYTVFASAGERHFVYQRVEPDSLLTGLLGRLRECQLLIDFPIRYGTEGVSVRLVGEEANIQALFDSVPEAVRAEVEIERISDYRPDSRDLRSRLTRRQREVLDTAVSEGYYAVPRRTTVDGLANELRVSQSTVSEHLRRIEATVFAALAEGSA